jgi:uncharacterized protein (DUF2147 family)
MPARLKSPSPDTCLCLTRGYRQQDLGTQLKAAEAIFDVISTCIMMALPRSARGLTLWPSADRQETDVMGMASLGRFRPHTSKSLAALLTAGVMLFAAHRADGQAAIPQGVWLIDGKAAVQIYDCKGLMCGRILWLHVPLNALGQLDRDYHNPDPALRTRELCGLTMLWNLHPDGPNRWKDGWFYNPDDGVTYRVSAQLKSDDVIIARIYLGVPLFGKTKTLARVPHGVSAGWC